MPADDKLPKATPEQKPSSRKTGKSRIIVLLAVIAALGLLTSLIFMNSIAAIIVADIAEEATQTHFTMGSIDVSLSGKGSAQNIAIGSPKGYEAKQAIQLKRVSATVLPFSVLSAPYKISSARVADLHLVCETNDQKNNLYTIRDNAVAYGRRSSDGGIELRQSTITGLLITFSFTGTEKNRFELSAGEATCSTTDGLLCLKQVRVSNPVGFTDTPAVEIDEISINFSLASLLKNVVQLDEVKVGEIRVTYQPGMPSSNMGTIQKLLNQLDAAGRSGADDSGKLIISKLSIGKIEGKAGPIRMALADINLKNVQSTSMAGCILSAALSIAPQMGGFISDISKGLKTGVIKAPEKLGEGVKAVGKTITDIFRRKKPAEEE